MICCGLWEKAVEKRGFGVPGYLCGAMHLNRQGEIQLSLHATSIAFSTMRGHLFETEIVAFLLGRTKVR